MWKFIPTSRHNEEVAWILFTALFCSIAFHSWLENRGWIFGWSWKATLSVSWLSRWVRWNGRLRQKIHILVVRWLADKIFLRFTHSQQFNFSLVLKGQITHADVAELADALDSGSSVLTDVEVQILSSALISTHRNQRFRWVFSCVLLNERCAYFAFISATATAVVRFSCIEP